MVNVHGGDIYNNIDVLDFSANINPLGLPRAVRIALSENIDKVVSYPDVQCKRLKEALSKKYNISEDFILCSNGAADLIYSLVFALRPRKALVLAPSFYEYEKSLKSSGCEVVYYYLEESNDFSVDEAILDRITPELDMIFICNPNNPTGDVIDRSLMLQIIDKCNESHILVLIDECFNEFLDNSKEITVADKVPEYDNLIVINAFTKLYAMPGLRLGFGFVSNLRIIEFVEGVTQPWNVSVLAQEAGIIALEQVNYVNRTKELIKQERAYLKEELSSLGFKVYGSNANFIFFKGERGIYEKCLENNILIRDCCNFEGLKEVCEENERSWRYMPSANDIKSFWEGYYRVAVRTHEENLKLIEAVKSV